ncbi:MAG: TIGR01212 family radical SAM protein [Ruminococcus sp.]|nr:TIGR01212 family radical SAM protein [Ruminococcus sp.]
MSNKFPYSDDNKRYHTLFYHNRHRFGHRIYKAVLNGGFTCPNLDGTKGTLGCAFCDGGSGAFTKALPLQEQLTLELARIRKQNPDAEAIAYFQVHTNTYAPVDYLRNLFEQAIAFNGIIGLSIGTRPDCLPDAVLDYLSDLNQRTYLTVELGLQTVHDRTAEAFGRGYLFSEFLESYQKLQKLNIRTCLHIINGLHQENLSDMLRTAETLGKLKPQAVKIQLLHVLKDTRYADLYQSGEYSPMKQEDYIFTVVKQLELFPPETVIERVTGDGEKAKLLAPLWSMDKIRTLGGIDKLQVQLDSWQGKAFKGEF